MADAALLKWANRYTKGHDNVTPATDLNKCWADGLCFCALLYTWFPEKIPIETLSKNTVEDKIKNLALAFKVAEEAGIDQLLDPEDTVVCQDTKSIILYLSTIYEAVGTLPAKFTASPQWLRKFEEEEKEKKLAELKARMEAERQAAEGLKADQLPIPGKVGDLQAKLAEKRAEEERLEAEEEERRKARAAQAAPTKEEEAALKKEREEAIKRLKEKREAEAKAKKEKEEAERKRTAELLEQRKKEMAAQGTTIDQVVPGSVEFAVSGTGSKGGPSKKLIIFTVNITVAGLKPNSEKTDLVCLVEGPSPDSLKINVQGGPGGMFYVGFTPEEPGQHWCDFVYKGVVASTPAFCLAVKNQFNKVPEFPYTGKKRAEAESKQTIVICKPPESNGDAEKAKEKAEKEEADRKAKEEAEKKAKEESEKKAKEEADRKAKEEAEKKAKEEAEKKAKEEADRKAKEESDRKAKEESDRKAKEESERKAKEEADRKAKEEADRLAKEQAEKERLAKEREEGERKAKEESDRLAREKAEQERKAKEESDRLAKEESDRKAKEEADKKEESDRLAKEEADRLAKEQAEREKKEAEERRQAEIKEAALKLAREKLEKERLAKEAAAREQQPSATARPDGLVALTLTFAAAQAHFQVLSNGARVDAKESGPGLYTFTHNVVSGDNVVEVKSGAGAYLPGFPVRFNSAASPSVEPAKPATVSTPTPTAQPVTAQPAQQAPNAQPAPQTTQPATTQPSQPAPSNDAPQKLSSAQSARALWKEKTKIGGPVPTTTPTPTTAPSNPPPEEISKTASAKPKNQMAAMWEQKAKEAALAKK